MTDKVWRMTFVGGDWDGQETLVRDFAGRPQSRFVTPFLDGDPLNGLGDHKAARTTYISWPLERRPPEGCEGPTARGYVYAAPGLPTQWHQAGGPDDDTLELIACSTEEVP